MDTSVPRCYPALFFKAFRETTDHMATNMFVATARLLVATALVGPSGPLGPVTEGRAICHPQGR